MYFDYALGGVNGNNINTDNNGTKDFVGRLSLTFPIGDVSTTLGGFGYYSGNTVDELTATSPAEDDAVVAVAYENQLWRAGPDISFTFDGPFYAKLFSQILFARDEDPTGFGKAAEWWGGFVQAEGKPLESLIVYARYEWIDGDRFNDTGVSINGVHGTIGAVDPHLWDAVFGTQYFLYDNFKLYAEYRHGVKDLNPGISPGVDPADQLDRTEDNAVFGGFRLVF
jgi:hypothetical protein